MNTLSYLNIFLFVILLCIVYNQVKKTSCLEVCIDFNPPKSDNVWAHRPQDYVWNAWCMGCRGSVYSFPRKKDSIMTLLWGSTTKNSTPASFKHQKDLKIFISLGQALVSDWQCRSKNTGILLWKGGQVPCVLKFNRVRLALPKQFWITFSLGFLPFCSAFPMPLPICPRNTFLTDYHLHTNAYLGLSKSCRS